MKLDFRSYLLKLLHLGTILVGRELQLHPDTIYDLAQLVLLWTPQMDLTGSNICVVFVFIICRHFELGAITYYILTLITELIMQR